MELCTSTVLGPGHIVSDGDPTPPPPKGHSPHFSAHIRCGQMAAWIKMSLGMELGLGPGDYVLDGDPAPPPPKGAEPPKFSAHVYCGQTALWIKMACTWHGCRPWSSPHCARWGHSSPPKNPSNRLATVHERYRQTDRTDRQTTVEPPIFGPSLLRPNGWMYQGATLVRR